MSEPRRIVVDIDGTLCEQRMDGAYELALPRWDVIDRLGSYYRLGWHVTLHTARGMRTCGGNVAEVERRFGYITRKWLQDQGVLFHELIFGKPPGDIYVDDRGVTPEQFVSYPAHV